jgi:membrane-associated protease RseP (regulator of RpoE activity)
MRHKAIISLMTVCLLALLTSASASMLSDAQDPGSSTRVYVVPGDPGEESGSSYLGVDTRDVTKERLSDLKLNKEEGVEVTMVDQDAPAGKAGLKEGDVILNLNGQAVESVEQLKRMIHEIPPGREVVLGVSRNGQPLTLKATLADRRKAFAGMRPGEPIHVEIPPINIPPMPEMDFPSVVVHYPSRAGLLVESLTPQLGEYFGVKNGEGVLVRSVQKGSLAEAAGFKAGDVIVKVGNTRIHDTSDWRMAMRDHRSGPVSIGVVRERHEQTLSLKMPERKQSRNSMELPNVEADVDLGQLQDEMRRIQPDLERVKAQAEVMRSEVMKHQAEWQKAAQKACAQAREEMRRQQKVLQEQLRKMQKEMRAQTDEL